MSSVLVACCLLLGCSDDAAKTTGTGDVDDHVVVAENEFSGLPTTYQGMAGWDYKVTLQQRGRMLRQINTFLAVEREKGFMQSWSKVCELSK